MKKYDHLRQKALELRHEGLALQEICERLGLGKGTVYPWVKGVPLQRASRSGDNFRTTGLGKGRNQKAYWKALRDAAYEEGLRRYPQLQEEPFFRDFIILYLTEGYRRCQNTVSVGNSNPSIVRIANYWITRESARKSWYQLQMHADQDEKSLKLFWGGVVTVPAESIKTQRKSNSGQLKGRRWRSQHGVLTVGTCDTYLRARIQAWMDLVEKEWSG